MNANAPTPLTQDDMRQLVALFNAGQYAAVEQRVQVILEQDERCAFAWQISGAALEKQGKDGLPALKTAVQLAPDDAIAHNNLGNALREHGKYAEAIASFRQALALKPDFAVAHCGLGLALRGGDQLDEAIRSYRHALIYRPDHLDAHNNLGNALQAQSKLGEAISPYRRACGINPYSAEVLNNLAGALLDSGNIADGIACLRQVLHLHPQSESAHRNLGNALQRAGNPVAAIASHREALALNPESAENYTNLGNVQWDAGLHNEAITSFQHAIKHDVDFGPAHYNLGNSYQFLGKFDQAISCYRRALELRPDFDTAFSSLLFAMGHSHAVDQADMFAEHCRFGERFETPLREHWLPHDNTRDPQRRLQIGFVSGDLRNHAVALFIEPIFAELAKCDDVSLHVYHNHVQEDAVSKRLRTLMPQWNAVAMLDDDTLAQKIRADGIDILIDLSGHTAHNRLLVFARKPAPTQVAWFGYPGTTGLQAMDYYFADRFTFPFDQFGPQFTEKIVHLPVSAPFLPNVDAPDVNPLPALANGYLTFGSFNRVSKISQAVVALWSQLLRALPDSRMLLGGMPGKDQCGDILRWFADEGIAEQRLEFHPRSDLDSFLRLHHRVDLCVDTFPYSGDSTVWQAIWMGVPTLSIAGNTSFGRAGVAIQGRIGLEGFAANNADEFIDIAVSWAARLDELAILRAQMRALFKQSIVGQPALFATSMNMALRTMWQRWCSGLPPTHF
jgi:predicted O-linked N-acetylglucosamine transferase (SPINDLY family)